MKLEDAARELNYDFQDMLFILKSNVLDSHGKPWMHYEQYFETVDGELCVKDDAIDWLSRAMFSYVYNIHESGEEMILGKTIPSYSDDAQTFFLVDDIKATFHISEKELNDQVDFYDRIDALINNDGVRKIKQMITKHGVYSFLYRMAKDTLDELDREMSA